MIKNLNKLNEYAIKKNASYILELPLSFDGEAEELIKELTKRYEDYIKLLKDFESSTRVFDLGDITNDIEMLYQCIISVIKNGDNAYSTLTNNLNLINTKYHLFDMIKKPLGANPLYRFCSYDANLTKPKEFYHCPTKYEGTNTRFGKPDNYLWYLGLSKEVCKYEAKGKIGSMATFVINEGTNPMLVLDLTQDGIFVDSSILEKKCYVFWWLLVCCYCVARNEGSDNITYIFPQLFSQYIKDNYSNISGIKYYTVRNDKLDPNENKYVNVALFTKEYNEEGYDVKLCENFKMIESEQNIKTETI